MFNDSSPTSYVRQMQALHRLGMLAKYASRTQKVRIKKLWREFGSQGTTIELLERVKAAMAA